MGNRLKFMHSAAGRTLSIACVAMLLLTACGDPDATNGEPGAAPSAPTSTPCDSPPVEEESGLIVDDVTCGLGPEAKKGDVLTVHYTGAFEDGEIFDTSKQPGRDPFQVRLGAGQVIQGWDVGLVGMHVGGTRKLTIPPELGYGPEDYNGIPGGSTLIFEIDLLDLQSGDV